MAQDNPNIKRYSHTVSNADKAHKSLISPPPNEKLVNRINITKTTQITKNLTMENFKLFVAMKLKINVHSIKISSI